MEQLQLNIHEGMLRADWLLPAVSYSAYIMRLRLMNIHVNRQSRCVWCSSSHTSDTNTITALAHFKLY